MGQISSLISLLASPFGLVLITCSVFALVKARSNLWLRWIVVAGLIFAASLNRYVNEWVPIPPSFWGPIDTVVGNGRAVTILFLSVLILMPTRYASAPMALPRFALAFVAVHMVIALKILSGGSIAFAILSLITVGLVFLLFAQINRRWVQNENDVDAAIVSIAAAASIFIMINIMQNFISPIPLAVAQGRFNGTTGNPQHAAAFLAVGIPALIYVTLTRSMIFKVPVVIVAVIGVFLLLWTGSRTGMLMGSCATLLLLRRSGPVMIGAMMITLTAGFYLFAIRSLSEAQLGRIVSFENTREAVWSALWRKFQAYPLTGAPISGDRLGFGENSWLAMGAATGIIGLLPLLIGGLLLLRLAWLLLRSRPPNLTAKLQGDFLSATIVSLMIGSVFEAYLLAVVSSATFILLLVGIAAKRRLALNAALGTPLRRSNSRTRLRLRVTPSIPGTFQ